MSYTTERFRDLHRKRKHRFLTKPPGDFLAWLCWQLEEGGCRSVLDLGCGELSWMATVDPVTAGTVAYHGTDVVETLLAHHRRVYPWFQGTCEDISERVRFPADIVVMTGILHWHCNGEGGQFLMNLARSTEWKFLVVDGSPGASRARGGLRGSLSAAFDTEQAMRDLGLRPFRRFRAPDREWLVYTRGEDVLEYLEIGAGDFETLAGTDERNSLRGLSVEPAGPYLAGIPSRRSGTRVHAAVGRKNRTGTVYYADPGSLAGKPHWLRGCGTLDQKHPALLEHCPDSVLEEEVDVLTVEALLDAHCAMLRHVGFLKINAGGMDVEVLLSWIDAVRAGKAPLPETIWARVVDLTAADRQFREVAHAMDAWGYERRKTDSNSVEWRKKD